MRTVLVVDDEFGVAEVLQSILEDEGYRVITAANGKRGLEKLAESGADLVIVDFMMPIMNGAQMVAAIHSDPALRHIPVVLMSSLDEATVRDSCSDYVGFIRKPFRVGAVIQLVKTLLA